MRGPRHSVSRGKTPVLCGEEVERLLSSIDVSSQTGLRDRAVIATMAYSFTRISAVTALKVGDVFRQKQRNPPVSAAGVAGVGFSVSEERAL